jgi:molybdopterin/thiamine biosynthesis adenylyltransferase
MMNEVDIDTNVHSFYNPPNVNEINPNDRFARNCDLIPQELLNSLSIIGCGGIGSALAIQTAIMGWRRVYFWDNDILKEHNLSTTTFPASFIKRGKAEAAREMQRLFGSEEQWELSGDNHARIDSNSNPMCLASNVIICTDNMKSREDTYHLWRQNKDRNIFVDIRMGALSINVATVTKDNDDYLNKDWYNDSDVIDEPCTQKHTIFTAQIAAGMGMKQMFLALKGVPYYAYITHNLSVEKHIVDQDRLIL